MAGRRDIEAGRAFVRLGVKNELKQQLGSALRGAGRLVANFAKVGAAGTAGVAAGLAAIVKRTAETGAELHKLGIQTGTSAKELSQLKFAAGQMRVEFEDVTGAIEENNIRLGEWIKDGTGPAGAALQALGLDAQRLADAPIAERLGMIGDALRKVGDRSRRQFLADEIFGGDAFKVLPLLEQGADGIARLTEEADRLGVTMSNETAAAGAETAAAIEQLKSATTGAAQEIGAAVLGSGDLASGLSDLATAIADVDWKTFAANGVEAFRSLAGATGEVTKSILQMFHAAQRRLIEFQIQALGGRKGESPKELLKNINPLTGGGVNPLFGLAVFNRARRNKAFDPESPLDVAVASLDESLARLEQQQAAQMTGFEGLLNFVTGRGGRRPARTPSTPFEAPPSPSVLTPQQQALMFLGPAMGLGLAGVGGGSLLQSSAVADMAQAATPDLLTFSAAAAQAAGFGGGAEDELMQKQIDELIKQTEKLDAIAGGLVHA